MDFFSPIEEDMVSRTEQDEDQERIAEKARKRAGNAGHAVFAVVRYSRPKTVSGNCTL